MVRNIFGNTVSKSMNKELPKSCRRLNVILWISYVCEVEINYASVVLYSYHVAYMFVLYKHTLHWFIGIINNQ